MILTDYSSAKLTNLFSEDVNLNSFATNQNTLVFQQLETETQREWHSAIASLEKILIDKIKTETVEKYSTQGLIISSPTNFIKKPELIKSLETLVFTHGQNHNLALMPCQKSSLTDHNQDHYINYNKSNFSSFLDIPLSIQDNLRQEQFCLIFTDEFSCLIVKGISDLGMPKFDFSFESEIIDQAWQLLRKKLVNYQYPQLAEIEKLVKKFPPINPDYLLVSQFNRYLLQFLKNTKINIDFITRHQHTLNQANGNQLPRKSTSISLQKTPLPPYPEVELLQALTHEIRTPLTTIKTITKLLIKKAKLSPDLIKHLETIEQECTEQINRMELIFRATELEATVQKQKQVKLVSISLEEILNRTIPCWQKQAQRRNIILDIIVPQKLPQIVSDPAILTQILGGLMEKFTRNIPNGGHFKVIILPAGNKLKLQFLSESNCHNHQTKYLGKLLLFQPDTGSLCLNPDVTKNIFQALGGKLIIKQKPDKGEILTVFLPLGNSNNNSAVLNTEVSTV